MADSQTIRRDNDVAEGTPFRRIRMDDDLWERLDEAVRRADPDDNRSALLRRLARWYVGDIAEIPRRPEPKTPKKLGSPQPSADLPLAGTQ